MSRTAAPRGLDSEVRGESGPLRTCVGCRQVTVATNLIRVVRDGERAVPDPRRSAAGRGAYLHLDPGCLEIAERRRALRRALRTERPIDVALVREFVVSNRVEQGTHGQPSGGRNLSDRSRGLGTDRE